MELKTDTPGRCCATCARLKRNSTEACSLAYNLVGMSHWLQCGCSDYEPEAKHGKVQD